MLAAPKLIRVAGDIKALASAIFAPWACAPFLAESEASKKARVPRPALARELFAKDSVEGKRSGGEKAHIHSYI